MGTNQGEATYVFIFLHAVLSMDVPDADIHNIMRPRQTGQVESC